MRPISRRLTGAVVLSGALGVLYVIVRLQSPPWMNPQQQTYLLAALTAGVGVVLQQLFSYILFDLLFRARKGREAPQLLRMVFSILCYAVIIVVIFTSVLGRNLSGMLAPSAVLTVILGLALQDTLTNFFAGVSLHIEQPFHIGDALRMADIVGRVESVTWRTTTVRTNNNSAIILPNSRIARDAIEVYTLHSLTRRLMRMPAPYSVSPETVIGLLRQVAASTPRVSSERPPDAQVAEFSDSYITYEILYWMEDHLWANEIEAVIRERVWYAFARHGIEIPFPVRHVLVDKPEPEEAGPVADYERVLAEVEILKPLSPRELVEVARSLVHIRFAPGEVVLRAGEAGDSMFVIFKGRAEVLTTDSAGNRQRVAVLERLEVIGEMALFTGEPRRADVAALEELEILEIRKPVIQHLFESNPLLAEAFSEVIGRRQSELMQMSTARAGAEKAAISGTILQRIKRLFSLT